MGTAGEKQECPPTNNVERSYSGIKVELLDVVQDTYQGAQLFEYPPPRGPSQKPLMLPAA